MKNEKEMTALEYFNNVKEKIQTNNKKNIKRMYKNCLILFNKYQLTEQVEASKRLYFNLQCLEKEEKVIDAGINKFIYKNDIVEFIENISNDPVKIIEMKRYSRDIPEDVVKKFLKVKKLFDEFYVVFTDYTGEETRKSEKEKDPILFGTFQDENNINERFYYIGDWIDDYCDLTLDKMINSIGEDKLQFISDNKYKTLKDVEKRINEIENKSSSRNKKKKIFKNLFTRK